VVLQAGNVITASTLAVTRVAETSLTLTDNSANYLEQTGTSVPTVNTTSFTSGHRQLYKITLASGVVVTNGIIDSRVSAVGIAGVGVASVPTGTGFVHITSAAQDSAARAIDLGSADVTATGSINFNSQKGVNALDPTNPQDVATKNYVDATAEGLDPKQSVRVATTANITLSGAQTIDGVSVIAGNRVLVQNQSTATQNGIYVCASGSWTRATDADTSAKVTAGLYVFSTEGTANADLGWVLTTPDPITLGSTSLAFAQFNSAASIGANSVTNAKLAQMASHTYKGNNTGSPANAADITSSQLVADLSATTGWPYDVGGGFVGVPTASVVLMRYPFPRTVVFPSGLTNSQGVAGTASTGTATFNINKNGSNVGTMVFTASAVATFTMGSTTTFNAGDILTVVAPASPDATLADIGFSLTGTR
jgi:hypothetical protein